MTVPDVHIASFEEIMELIGGAELVVVSVFLRIEGDAPGNIFSSCRLPRAKDSLKK